MIFVVSNIDTEKYIVFSDIPGHTAAGGGSIPPQFCITQLKPDTVIIDKSKKSRVLFELTCPLEENIDKAKCDKYDHFVTDSSSVSKSCLED